MKKMLSFLLSASMLISTLPVMAASGDEYFTDTRTVDYDAVQVPNQNGAYSTTAADYKFTVGDETYSLLDVSSDENSKYFVIGANVFARAAAFIESENVNYFSSDSTWSGSTKEYYLPTWYLNGEYFQKGWATNPGSTGAKQGVSAAVREYIDNNHVWTCEPAEYPDFVSGDKTVNLSNEKYTYTAGIALPSVSEVKAYADRFVEKDTGSVTGIATRTMLTYESTETRQVGVISTTSDLWNVAGWALPSPNVPIRPCFWLNSQFFANVAVDLATAGAAVKQEIKKIKPSTLVNIYEKSVLKTYLGLTDEDLAEKYFDDPISVNYTPVDFNEWISTEQVNADPKYVFTVGDEAFTLLDMAKSSSSRYFVIANQSYGNRSINNYTQGVMKNPTEEEIAAATTDAAVNQLYANYFLYFLNDRFMKYGNGTGGKINSDIVDCIDTAHEWETEAAPNAGTPIAENYTFKAGVAVPSVSELKAYKTRLGYNDTGVAFVTRTILKRTTGSTNTNWQAVANNSGSATNGWRVSHWSLDNGVTTNIRPCFWVNENFFANVAVDLSTAGAAVKQEIKKLGVETLLDLYSPEDITNYLGVEIPEDTVALYNVKVKTRSGENPAYGETLSANYEFLSGAGLAAKSADITWKKLDGETETTLGTGKEYIVTEADAATGSTQIYFDIKVTSATGNVIEKTSKKVTIPSLGVAPVAANSQKTIKENADDADKFTLDGKSFTLIKAFDNDESTFFVTVNDNYGVRQVNSAYMNPNDDESYLYWLNTAFKNYGNGDNKLPDGIVNYINNEHVWLTEGAPNNTVSDSYSVMKNDNYSFKAGVAPLSASEIIRYSDVIGSAEAIGGGYFTRTAVNWQNGKDDTQYLLCANPQTSGSGDSVVFFAHWDLPSQTNIRPSFYLTKEFFKNVEFDLESGIGENVLNTMRDMYYIEDLDGIYDADTLADLGFKHKAELSVSYSAYGAPSNILEKLEGATSLQANITLTAANAGIDATAILAIYNGSGKLVNVTTGSLASDTTEATAAIGFDALSDIGAGYYAMVMIWDGMTPITGPDVFDSNDMLNIASAVTNLSSESRGNNFF